MLKAIVIINLIFLIPFGLQSQVSPKEGRILNYRLIGFSIPAKQKITDYTIEIAIGKYVSESSFIHNITTTVHSASNKIIAEVPNFGSQYTWRAVYSSSNSITAKSELHHFSTGTIPELDTNATRLRVITGATKFKDAEVIIETSR